MVSWVQADSTGLGVGKLSYLMRAECIEMSLVEAKVRLLGLGVKYIGFIDQGLGKLATE